MFNTYRLTFAGVDHFVLGIVTFTVLDFEPQSILFAFWNYSGNPRFVFPYRISTNTETCNIYFLKYQTQ
jgi:hypothetical protein